MREILFRAKDLRDKWIYGYYDGSDTRPALIEEKDNIGAFWIKGETLGQFIGLTDSNGVKIFEGDIIKTAIGNVIVIFKACGFMGEVIGKQFYYDLYDDNLEFVEVIGNIYDNTKLL